jgi:hypothetical protein
MSAQSGKQNGLGVWRLIWVPGLISLAVTLLRLTGELLHWSEAWFSTATGGVVPSGMRWLVGITWLAAPFGIYFAVKLVKANRGPSSRVRAVGLGFLGTAVASVILFYRPGLDFPVVLLFVWAVMAVGALVQFAAWPQLARVMTAYGLAARIPVVVIMFLAMLGSWGTHYDYVGVGFASQMSFWPRFFWLAFFPQLIFWLSFTVVIGVLCGAVASAFMAGREKPS